MSRSFKILEHPADVGIEAAGSTLAEAFGAAAEGLLSILIEPFEPAAGAIHKTLLVAALDESSLLVRWLSEILYLFDGQHFAPAAISEVTIDFDGAGLVLKAGVAGELLDSSRHTALLDVKAVTYHQIAVRKAKEGVVVRVFVDI